MVSKDIELKKTENCKNCGSKNIDNYCSNCGQMVYQKRFTLKSYLISLFNLFSVEKGFFYSLIMLFIRPGILINDYLKGKTRIYINPLKYLLIVGGIFAFVMIKTDILDISYKTGNEIIYNSTEELQKEYKELQHKDQELKMQQNILSYLKKYVNIVPLFIIPFYSLVGLWFYRSRKLFYGEFLIIFSYTVAQTFLISVLILVPLVLIFTELKQFFPLISLISAIIYISYLLFKTFDQSLILSAIKGVLVYTLGTILFWIALIILFILLAIALGLIGINLIDVLSQ